MHAFFAKVEKLMKRLPTTLRMKRYDHVKAPAKRSQNPVRPVLLRVKNVRCSQPMAILKPTRRLRFDMPVHHTETAA
ncbi:hypothetical protein D3C85_1552070 [compost metagenome]